MSKFTHTQTQETDTLYSNANGAVSYTYDVIEASEIHGYVAEICSLIIADNCQQAAELGSQMFNNFTEEYFGKTYQEIVSENLMDSFNTNFRHVNISNSEFQSITSYAKLLYRDAECITGNYSLLGDTSDRSNDLCILIPLEIE